MNKKIICTLLIVCVLMLVGCGKKEEKKDTNKDAIKFKEEYESLNGKTNNNGLEHRTISVSEDNPYVYITAEEVVKMIEDGETFYLYVGDKQCPWCRSVIEKSIEVANKYHVKKIYYVNIWDDDHNEILRDVYKLDENGKPVVDSKGTDAYYKLLEHFDKLLRDYTLTDSEGNVVEVGEKRIYAPNYFYIEKGKAVKLVSGKSDKQKDSREELTEEMLADEEEAFDELFSYSMACDSSC